MQLLLDFCFSELNMYLSTLPDLQRLLNQNGENIEFAPK